MYTPLAVEILIAEPKGNDLEDLSTVAKKTEELHVGQVREVYASQDLHFDIGLTIGVVRSVTAVITGIGGAVKLIDWALAKLRERRGETMVFKAGATTVTIKTGDDQERVRKLLQ